MGNKAAKLSEEELKVLMEKTNFSDSQIKQWYKGFMVSADFSKFSKSQTKQWYKGFMKDCPSGELSRKKFLSIYNTLFPEGKAGAFYEHVFRTFDEDGSGKIDFGEFLQAISVTQAGKPEDKLELAFRLYDIDRNGCIEEHEMAEIIKAIYLMTENDTARIGDAPEMRTKDIFSKMDSNLDGVLSKEEFIQGCLGDDTLYKLLACSQGDTATEET